MHHPSCMALFYAHAMSKYAIFTFQIVANKLKVLSAGFSCTIPILRLLVYPSRGLPLQWGSMSTRTSTIGCPTRVGASTTSVTTSTTIASTRRCTAVPAAAPKPAAPTAAAVVSVACHQHHFRVPSTVCTQSPTMRPTTSPAAVLQQAPPPLPSSRAVAPAAPAVIF